MCSKYICKDSNTLFTCWACVYLWKLFVCLEDLSCEKIFNEVKKC